MPSQSIYQQPDLSGLNFLPPAKPWSDFLMSKTWGVLIEGAGHGPAAPVASRLEEYRAAVRGAESAWSRLRATNWADRRGSHVHFDPPLHFSDGFYAQYAKNALGRKILDKTPPAPAVGFLGYWSRPEAVEGLIAEAKATIERLEK